mgnify:CR=1 FL=1
MILLGVAIFLALVFVTRLIQRRLRDNVLIARRFDAASLRRGRPTVVAALPEGGNLVALNLLCDLFALSTIGGIGGSVPGAVALGPVRVIMPLS